MHPPQSDAGARWTCVEHGELIHAWNDSLLAKLADTVEVVSATIDVSLWGTMSELGLNGGSNLACCRVLQDSLGWGHGQQPGDTVEAVLCHDRLRWVRAFPRNRRGFYEIALGEDGMPETWQYVPQVRWSRLRSVTMEVTSTVYEAIESEALPESLTPSGRIATRRDSVRACAYVVEFQQDLTDHLFAYDIDFYYDVRGGDSIWVLFEEVRYPETDEVGFSRILAAKYKFENGSLVEAFPFHHPPDSTSSDDQGLILDHYHRDGASLRTMFLKMPVPFGRISSPYSSARLHPILGYTRAHRGIDYAAPLGTEIYAVGDGTITRRSWNGGFGNYVRLRHSNGYETEYGHLSSYAAGQAVGTHVRQGEVIGYVGNTGLSTGPHVHFGMKKNGSYVNPSTEITPPADPLEGRELERFQRQVPALESIWEEMAGGKLPKPSSAGEA
jgi:murein DD-endopeptidase MepM/ murein hydrolase activator NlpD